MNRHHKYSLHICNFITPIFLCPFCRCMRFLTIMLVISRRNLFCQNHVYHSKTEAVHTRTDRSILQKWVLSGKSVFRCNNWFLLSCTSSGDAMRLMKCQKIRTSYSYCPTHFKVIAIRLFYGLSFERILFLFHNIIYLGNFLCLSFYFFVQSKNDEWYVT